ncbi:MAG: ABC transporter substrate-binding protein [Candidatus Lambdaproteobacteria bacterium]|nr:ABC transporter substrate-binding protein [Candidatus Lambdaproteobacteria bacterium]
MNAIVAKYRFAHAIPAFAAAVWLSMAAVPADVHGAEVLKIGYVGGISGACAGLTPPAIKAMKMAVEEINNAGGMGGRRVEFIIRDSKTKPDEGAKQARDLNVSDKVEALVGVCSSSVFLSVNAVSKEYNVPLFSAQSGTHKTTIDFGHPAVFQTHPNTITEGNALAEFTALKGWKRIVTMGLDYEWGRTTVAVYEARLKQLNPSVKITRQLWPKIGETNMTSYITAALADNPDAVMAVMFGVSANSLIKQGKSYGLFSRTNVLTFLSTETLMDMAAELPDGVYGWSRGPAYALKTEKGADFVRRYSAKYDGEFPTDWAVLGYDEMLYIKAILDRTNGNTDAVTMSNAAASFTYDSLRGPIRSRTIDNTVNAPSYIGVTKKIPEYPFPVLVDVEIIPGDKLLPTEAEVKQMRAEAAK